MNWKFNPRVAAIIQDSARARILLCRQDGVAFWMLPGGRIEIGESSTNALRREIREELGVELKTVEFIWFIENLFEHGGQAYHEHGLYFLCDIEGAFEDRTEFQGAESSLTFAWVPKHLLASFDLRPKLLTRELMNLHTGMRFMEVREI